MDSVDWTLYDKIARRLPDGLADLRPKNDALRKLRKMIAEAEKAIRNTEA